MDQAELGTIRSFLSQGTDLTLATVRPDGFPQATTVSYVADGLTVYFGCGDTSQKAANLSRNPKVSFTVDLPYRTWEEIRGLSAAGLAAPVTEAAEIAKISQLMLAKFPELAGADSSALAHMTLFKIEPKVFSVLDYAKGFGHTQLVEL